MADVWGGPGGAEHVYSGDWSVNMVGWLPGLSSFVLLLSDGRAVLSNAIFRCRLLRACF